MSAVLEVLAAEAPATPGLALVQRLMAAGPEAGLRSGDPAQRALATLLFGETPP